MLNLSSIFFMRMTALAENDYRVPYLNAGETLRQGLNLLGIRNVAENLYSQLLPGLNNVTIRIRYYSFYCWIIREFYALNKDASKIKKEVFNQFIRRAEYLLALIEAQSDNRGGLPGINFAINHLGDSDVLALIADGADKLPYHSTYWANQGGALAQYYSASLQDLGLIARLKENSDFLNITHESDLDAICGEQLAQAFEDSIEGCLPGCKQVFIAAIENGVISKEDLNLLQQPFYMHSVAEFPAECKLLMDLLRQKDWPTLSDSDSFYRENTIQYLLQYGKVSREKKSDLDFARYVYENCVLNGEPTGAQIRWYAYYLNEEWQYHFTRLFSALLEELKPYPSGCSLQEFVPEFASKIMIAFKNVPMPEVMQTQLRTLDDYDWQEENQSSKEFYILLNLVRINSTKYAQELGALNQTYNYFQFAQKVEGSQLKLKEFVEEFILEDLIYRHYATSFIKQNSTGISTQKFILENDVLTYCASYDATHSSPRVNSLFEFLCDLNYMSKGWITNDVIDERSRQ